MVDRNLIEMPRTRLLSSLALLGCQCNILLVPRDRKRSLYTGTVASLFAYVSVSSSISDEEHLPTFLFDRILEKQKLTLTLTT